MVKSLSDICLDLISYKIEEFQSLTSSVTIRHKTDILGRLCIHQRISTALYPVIERQLLSSTLQDLILQQCQQVDDHLLRLIGANCTGLKSFEIISCSSVTDNGLQLAFKSLHKIENLRLVGLGKIKGSCFAHLFAKNLHAVDLKHCENIGDSGISALVQNCQAICSLNLYGCSMLTDCCIEFVAGYLLGRLHTLICSNIGKITDLSLIAIADRCYSLRRLKLHGCTKITSTGLRAVFKACPLSTTDLSYCYALSKESDVLIDCIPVTLTRLILRGTQVPVVFYESLASRCKSINTLKLCGILSLTDEAACQMLEKIGGGLENLDLSWCATLTDDTVQCIMHHCTKLVKLGLSYCRSITGEPLKELALISRKKQAEKLTKLAVQACRQFKTEIFIDILPHLPDLEYIGVSGQMSFTNEHLFCLAKNCQKLIHLNVKGCLEVSDSGVCELVRCCTRLESLVLAGLHMLTDKSIFFIASSISTTLLYLYISGCSQISRPAVTYLKDVCINYLFVEHKIPNAAPDQLMARNLDTGEFCRADLIPSSE